MADSKYSNNALKPLWYSLIEKYLTPFLNVPCQLKSNNIPIKGSVSASHIESNVFINPSTVPVNASGCSSLIIEKHKKKQLAPIPNTINKNDRIAADTCKYTIQDKQIKAIAGIKQKVRSP